MALTDNLLLDYDFEELSGNAVDSVSGVTMTHTGPTPFDNIVNAGAGNLYNGSTHFSKIDVLDNPTDSTIDITYRLILRYKDISAGNGGVLMHEGANTLIQKRALDDKLAVNIGSGPSFVSAVADSAAISVQKIDLVVTVNDTTVIMYIDGVAQAIVGTAGDRSGSEDIFINSFLGISLFSNVTTSVFTVWQRGLSAAEVSTLHNGGVYKTFNTANLKFKLPRITTNLRAVYLPSEDLNLDQVQGFTWTITSILQKPYSAPWNLSVDTTSGGRVVAPINKVFPNNAEAANDRWSIRQVIKPESNANAETLMDFNYGGAFLCIIVKDGSDRFRVSAMGSATVTMHKRRRHQCGGISE